MITLFYNTPTYLRSNRPDGRSFIDISGHEFTDVFRPGFFDLIGIDQAVRRATAEHRLIDEFTDALATLHPGYSSVSECKCARKRGYIVYIYRE